MLEKIQKIREVNQLINQKISKLETYLFIENIKKDNLYNTETVIKI
jgi:hypothetical protein